MNPREILLNKHKGMEGQLTLIRRSVISTELAKTEAPAVHPASAARRWPTLIAHTVWNEIFRPARLVWSGFAAVWLLILLANVADAVSGRLEARTKGSSTEILIAWQQQQRWAQLVDAPQPVSMPGTINNQPRSEAVPARRTDMIYAICT